jgi:hypothetical protein
MKRPQAPTNTRERFVSHKNALWDFTLYKHTSKYTKKNLGGF